MLHNKQYSIILRYFFKAYFKMNIWQKAEFD